MSTEQKDSIVVGDFKQTGGNVVDVEKVCSKWNHLWSISQWGDEFRLIKGVRKDSPIVSIKLLISKVQAMALIAQLDLVQMRSSTFRRASTWRKDEHFK